jgi:hypothetical protein
MQYNARAAKYVTDMRLSDISMPCSSGTGMPICKHIIQDMHITGIQTSKIKPSESATATLLPCNG